MPVRTVAFVAAMAFVAAAAHATDLKAGLVLEPSSIDPHYHNFTPNNAIAQHFFDGIANFNEHQQPVPGIRLRIPPQRPHRRLVVLADAGQQDAAPPQRP